MSLILKKIFLLLIVKSVFCNTVENQITDEQRLIKYVLNNYDTMSRPVFNASKSVQIKFQMSLIQIYKLDDINQVLTTNVWLYYEWNDQRLSWDPNKYNGLQVLRLPSEKLWRPDIILYNNADDLKSKYVQTNVVINNNGNVLWIPPARFKSTCKINIKYFPFDVQSCSMKFGSWTYDKSKIDLVLRQNDVETSDFFSSGEWKFISARATRNEIIYACCKEIYPDITFTITMKRRTLYYIYNIILPCLWLTILSLLSFWLPPDSGEKITLGITVLLTFSVFMLLISGIIPTSIESVPLIGIYLTVLMATNFLSIVFTVVVLHIHHTGLNRKRIPPKIRRLFFDILAPKLGTTTVCRSEMRKQNKVSSKERLSENHNVSTRQMELDKTNFSNNKDHLAIENPKDINDNNVSNLNLMLERTIDQYSEIIRNLHRLNNKQQEDELDQEIITEWKMLAHVLDRCLFWIFAAIAGSAIIIILLIMPLFK